MHCLFCVMNDTAQRLNGSTIGKDRDSLTDEKTMLLAAINHDVFARDMTDSGRKQARARIVQIQHQLSTWSVS